MNKFQKMLAREMKIAMIITGLEPRFISYYKIRKKYVRPLLKNHKRPFYYTQTDSEGFLEFM